MRRLGFVLAIAAALGGCTRPRAPQPVTLTVSLAASLQNAMQEIQAIYERTGVRLTFNFGASGTLAQQIENGAPVDVFLSAAPKPLDGLEAKGLILAGTRRNLLRNRIVLVAPAGTAAVRSFQDLAGAGVKLVALGNPDSVPAGDYGRQTLQALRLWAAVEEKLVLAKDVRQVLSYVETGNADAGIVYETDARESSKVRVVAAAPAGTHAPIVYPVAVIRDSRNAEAARHVITAYYCKIDRMGSPQARQLTHDRVAPRPAHDIA